jgi:hypothetical protein
LTVAPNSAKLKTLNGLDIPLSAFRTAALGASCLEDRDVVSVSLSHWPCLSSSTRWAAHLEVVMSRQKNLAAAYSTVGIPLDQLPYSEGMGRLIAALDKADDHPKSERETWRELVDLRKRGLLPKVGRIRQSI